MLSRHISYLKDFFRSYKDFTTAQLDTIELMLQKLYRRFDMDDYTDFSQVAPEKFPTMSDFLRFTGGRIRFVRCEEEKPLFGGNNSRSVPGASLHVQGGGEQVFQRAYQYKRR